MTARILTGKVLSAGEIAAIDDWDYKLAAHEGEVSLDADNWNRAKATLRAYGAVVEAARLRRNTRISDTDKFPVRLVGTWVAVPKEDFDALRAALRSLPEGEKERGCA